MSKQEWMIGIIGLLAGVVITVGLSAFYFSSHHNGAGMREMMKDFNGENMMDGGSSSLDSAAHLSHRQVKSPDQSCDGQTCQLN